MPFFYNRAMRGKTVFFAVLFAAVSALAFAQEFEPEENLTWQRAGNGARIVGYKGGSADLRIPPVINGRPVTEIGARAFKGAGLTGLTIPGSVVSISDEAFAGNRLSDITIPDGVTSVGINAFADNPVGSITIGNGIDTFNGDEIFGTASLRTVTRISIPAGIALLASATGGSDVLWQFGLAYWNNKEKAGIYTLSGGQWAYQAR
jgi:hypothetical protein